MARNSTPPTVPARTDPAQPVKTVPIKTRSDRHPSRVRLASQQRKPAQAGGEMTPPTAAPRGGRYQHPQHGPAVADPGDTRRFAVLDR